MIHFMSDILAFLKSLSLIDYILYFAVLVLVILIVSLVYIMKLDDSIETETVNEKKDNDVDSDSIDLQHIMENINENPKPIIDMTKYEEEQEEKAIISYDELIACANTKPINYDEEELIDNAVMVKKINLEKIASDEINEEVPRLDVKLMKYEREEAFLKVLKQMNELLN